MRVVLRDLSEKMKRKVYYLFRTEYLGVSPSWMSKHGVRIYQNSNIAFDTEFGGSSSSLNAISEAEIFSDNFLRNLPRQNAPREWNAGEELIKFIFAFLKTTEVINIVETGVANGAITNTIMSASASDREFNLHSFDVNPNCKDVLNASEKWTFIHLKGIDLRKSLAKYLKELPEIDLWIHDADHSYEWQRFEYTLALSKLSRNGWIFSDDVDSSPAWSEFVSKNALNSFIVFDGNKFFGVASRKN